MTVKRIQQVVDLDGAGYVEEEFFVSGTGNAYDWAQDGSLSVLASGLPYTTRIMVRRPVNASRFSGNVVVELINNSRTYDWPMAWSVLFPHILESGHAYVGISIRPRGIDSDEEVQPDPVRAALLRRSPTAVPGKRRRRRPEGGRPLGHHQSGGRPAEDSPDFGAAGRLHRPTHLRHGR